MFSNLWSLSWYVRSAELNVSKVKTSPKPAYRDQLFKAMSKIPRSQVVLALTRLLTLSHLRMGPRALHNVMQHHRREDTSLLIPFYLVYLKSARSLSSLLCPIIAFRSNAFVHLWKWLVSTNQICCLGSMTVVLFSLSNAGMRSHSTLRTPPGQSYWCPEAHQWKH